MDFPQSRNAFLVNAFTPKTVNKLYILDMYSIIDGYVYIWIDFSYVGQEKHSLKVKNSTYLSIQFTLELYVGLGVGLA